VWSSRPRSPASSSTSSSVQPLSIACTWARRAARTSSTWAAPAAVRVTTWARASSASRERSMSPRRSSVASCREIVGLPMPR